MLTPQTCPFHKTWETICSDKPRNDLTELTENTCHLLAVTARCHVSQRCAGRSFYPGKKGHYSGSTHCTHPNHTVSRVTLVSISLTLAVIRTSNVIKVYHIALQSSCIQDFKPGKRWQSVLNWYFTTQYPLLTRSNFAKAPPPFLSEKKIP